MWNLTSLRAARACRKLGRVVPSILPALHCFCPPCRDENYSGLGGKRRSGQITVCSSRQMTRSGSHLLVAECEGCRDRRMGSGDASDGNHPRVVLVRERGTVA